MAGHGRRRRGHAAEHENEERWLLTYSDMITLLMALFMVLFSITSVNKSKLQVLTKSLQQAFSGEILPGGRSIQDNGGGPSVHSPAPQPPIPAIQPLVANQSTPTGQLSHGTVASASAASSAAGQAASEQQDFEQIKQQIDHFVHTHGLQNQVQTQIDQRGLVIRLLTDKVLFDSGQADLKAGAGPLLDQVASLLRNDTGGHDVMVEGHTDNIPIAGSEYPTNWELSTARAARVVRYLIGAGVPGGRLGAVGYADLHPIASNDTPDGRSLNRRVEIVLLRSGQGAAQGGNGL